MAKPIPYRDIPALLKERKPFQGESMSATLHPNGTYLIRSYSTTIGIAFPGQAVKEQPSIKSKITSRHRGLMRAYVTAG